LRRIPSCCFGSLRQWPPDEHLRGAPLAPVPLSLPPLSPLRHTGDGRCLARTIHEYLLRRPILSPGGAFLVRPPRRTGSTPRQPYLREAPAGFGLERLATAFMNNPGLPFLCELCIGSPLPVREPTSFQQRRKHDGYQQQPREHTAMWQHQSDDLAKCQREGGVKDQSGAWHHNETSIDLSGF
jgi:hypothetical protein